ncbi:MAG: helix-turn-helix domain-containing protein [Actinomycetota bacterium]|nr:helix-turn-helix domain-containing protein [Actinomycetota bacterium]
MAQQHANPPRDPEIAELAAALWKRIDNLADGMAGRIRDEIDFYRSGALVEPDDLHASCAANIEFVLASIGGDVHDPAAARATGRRRAGQGAPLPEVTAAFRIGFHDLWDAVVAEAAATGVASHEALVRAASQLWDVQAIYTDAMSTAYRDVLSQQLLAHDQERSALVEALLEGRLRDGSTVWEMADLLRLPHHGPFVVVAAEPPELGRQALPAVEARLGGVGLASAWRLMPDLQVGVVCLQRSGQLDRLVEWLRGNAIQRVGVSPPYDELGGTGQALRFARIALSGSVAGALVTVFDSAPLAVAAVGTPDVMARFVHNVLGGLDDLPRDDRTVLLDTFEAWLDAGGSANDTAERLFCHPNTVRHRMRRIEERTGRSLTDPRAVTELCLAVEALRRLPT